MARKWATGFTLVEVLVVVAILGVLAGLILPALASSKQYARRMECLNNLRQLAVAAQLYANNYGGSYPSAYYRENRNGSVYNHAWDYTTINGGGTPESVLPGILWQGERAGKVLQCPCYRGPANWLSDPHTGYNYNTSYIGHGENEAIQQPANINDVANPGGTALFGDGEYRAGANKFMRAPFPGPGDATFGGRYAGTQGFRHQGMTNVAFCDGHTDSLGTCYTETSAHEKPNIAAGTGFLSKDNSLYDLE